MDEKWEKVNKGVLMVSLISNYLKGSRRNSSKPKFVLKVKLGEIIVSYEEMLTSLAVKENWVTVKITTTYLSVGCISLSTGFLNLPETKNLLPFLAIQFIQESQK